MEKLAESIRRLGWVKPVIARRLEDGALQILGGQHRVEAAASMGEKTVPVLVLENVDDVKAKEIGLVDNARYGVDDAIGLADLVQELGGAAALAGFLPFSDDELAMLATDISGEDIDKLLEEPAPSEAEPPAPRPVKTHDVMRFKVPIEDADQIRETLEAIIEEMGYTDSDSLVNAGDALVWLVSDWRAKGDPA